jgi:hypothetical protein
VSSTATTDHSSRAQVRHPPWQAALLAAVLWVPGALLIVATAAMLLALPFGVDPLWYVEPLTLPEAAALRDNGEIVRLIDRGADPNAAGPVRANFLREDPQVVTPLEAAVGIDRGDIVQTLLDHGARLDAQTWTRLTCFATSIDAGDARAVLEAHRPDGAAANCESIENPW